MRRSLAIAVFGFQIALVTGLAFILLRPGIVPLGVPGQWEWPRLSVPPELLGLMVAVPALGLFAAFVALGWKVLDETSSQMREAGWVAGLGLASVVVQVLVLTGAPSGYGLAKWVTLGLNGSSGYFSTARREIRDPWRFWASYPSWIARQDSLHIGTHPPGLLLASWTLRHTFEAHPAWRGPWTRACRRRCASGSIRSWGRFRAPNARRWPSPAC